MPISSLPVVLAGVVGYLVGSIPPGYLVARAFGHIDLLNQGSGRTGTTNVLRTLGWRAAALVFAGDFVKGVSAVLLARVITGGDPVADLVAGLAVMVGHNYSLFLRFKGGRGVVAGLGGIAVIAPVVLLVCAVVGILLIALTRYVSLGSIIGSAVAAVALLVLTILGLQPWPHLAYGMVGATFVIVSHRDNIGRLFRGTERKLGEKAGAR